MNLTEKKFSNKSDTNNDLLNDFVKIVDGAIANCGKASALLSGGTSPIDFYKLLSNIELDWEKIFLSLSDERWVDTNSDDSNEKLIKDVLIQNKASLANFIGLKSDGDIKNSGCKKTEDKLKKLPQPFDIVLLGMGNDGHTASLFPDSPDTINALDMNADSLTMPIIRENQDIARITMTLKTLLSSRHIKLLFFGEEKWQIYKKAKEEKTIKYPISYILHQDIVPVTIYYAES